MMPISRDIILEYRRPTLGDRIARRRWAKRQIDGLLGKDYTWHISILAVIGAAVFMLVFMAWMEGGIAEGASGGMGWHHPASEAADLPENGDSADAQADVRRMALVVISNPNGTLNVRKEPSMDSKVVSVLDWHDVVEIDAEADGFCRVRYPGSTNALGWASRKYLAVMK